jgi:hypothetical protein
VHRPAQLLQWVLSHLAPFVAQRAGLIR